jgi:phospholipase C
MRLAATTTTTTSLATNCGDWANTVVLMIWDDWGGWYDHVLALALQQRRRL